MSRGRESRALAAGETVTVNKKTYRLRPVNAQNLSDLERDALTHHKRVYLKTFSDNADLLNNGKGDELLIEEMRRVANWDVEDLPQKVTYGVWNVPVTDKLKKWIKDEIDIDLDDKDKDEAKAKTNNDRMARAVLATSLDDGTIKPSKVKELTGQNPIKGRVRYDQWWVTGSRTGMIFFIFNSIKVEHTDVSFEDIGKWPYDKLIEAARLVEQLTVASMGNG